MEYSNDYVTWKQWQRPFHCDDFSRRYFVGEMRGIKIAGARVLELGFGEGRFLAWAKTMGATVVGYELINELAEAGRALGFDTRSGDVMQRLDPNTDQFDLIVAFDVLEHVDSDRLIDLAGFLRRLLVPGGHLVARVPNGQSPLGQVFQYGDLTHVSVLSKGRFEQLAALVDLQTVRCDNAYRVTNTGWEGLMDRCRFRLRDWVQSRLCALYNLGPLPFDPNIVVVLRRPI